MKKILIGAAIIVTIAVVVFVSVWKNESEAPLDTGTAWFAGQGEFDAYVFPPQEEWIDLMPQERVAALQIPENNLEGMSTAGLAETCLNYPMYVNMAFYDSLEIGFQRIRNQFNGLQALFLRADVADILVPIFVSMDLNKLNQYDVYPTMKFHYVCIMLYQDEVVAALTDEQRKELNKAVSEKKRLINSKYDDHFSLYNLEILEQRIV
ncbi:MAG: hypothetical protein FWG72_09055 [Oscillospiraceae bacterium]|nr:hypothetical protein [Oscillospiraceae bacterium]